MCVAGTNIFQQDNAPCHTARRVIKWLADNDIELLDWPGNSSDIKPIENLWSIIKARIQEGRYEKIPQLKPALSRFWCLDVTPEVCIKLVAFMPERINLVLKTMDTQSSTDVIMHFAGYFFF